MKEMKRHVRSRRATESWPPHRRRISFTSTASTAVCVLPSCPTYRVLGSEMDSPRGRIYLMRALDEGRAQITDTFVEHMFRCLDCRACETACPVRRAFRPHDGRDARRDRRPASGALDCAADAPARFSVSLAISSRVAPAAALSALGHAGCCAGDGIAEAFAPGMATAEALMPELPIESGVTLRQDLSRGRRTRRNGRILYRLRHELDARFDQPIFRAAAQCGGL